MRLGLGSNIEPNWLGPYVITTHFGLDAFSITILEGSLLIIILVLYMSYPLEIRSSSILSLLCWKVLSYIVCGLQDLIQVWLYYHTLTCICVYLFPFCFIVLYWIQLIESHYQQQALEVCPHSLVVLAIVHFINFILC